MNSARVIVAALAISCAHLMAQQPAPAGRGSGPRGADPLVLDDHVGFDAMFDGVSLKGWDGDPAFWRVDHGAIVGDLARRRAG